MQSMQQYGRQQHQRAAREQQYGRQQHQRAAREQQRAHRRQQSIPEEQQRAAEETDFGPLDLPSGCLASGWLNQSSRIRVVCVLRGHTKDHRLFRSRPWYVCTMYGTTYGGYRTEVTQVPCHLLRNMDVKRYQMHL